MRIDCVDGQRVLNCIVGEIWEGHRWGFRAARLVENCEAFSVLGTCIGGDRVI